MKVFVVDAFTREAFTGNPAGVCILEEERPDSWMQKLAREMNHPETAFLRKEAEGYELRWFTPTVEVPLCGHATLASAHVLSTVHGVRGMIRFRTRFSGDLFATVEGERILLDFPALLTARPESPEEIEATRHISRILGGGIEDGVVHRGASETFYLARLVSPGAVRNSAPDISALLDAGVGQLIVTAADGESYDFVSRFFAPGFGIDEDPVTGAAHCVLAPYWSEILGAKEFRAYQASERGGELTCKFGGGRVTLGGTAITVMEMNLLV